MVLKSLGKSEKLQEALEIKIIVTPRLRCSTVFSVLTGALRMQKRCWVLCWCLSTIRAARDPRLSWWVLFTALHSQGKKKPLSLQNVPDVVVEIIHFIKSQSLKTGLLASCGRNWEITVRQF